MVVDCLILHMMKWNKAILYGDGVSVLLFIVKPINQRTLHDIDHDDFCLWLEAQHLSAYLGEVPFLTCTR